MNASEAEQMVREEYPMARLYHSPVIGYVISHRDEDVDYSDGDTSADAAWISAASRLPAPKPIEPTQVEAGEVEPAVKLLADVMHLWVDGYISKDPNSMAEDSISKNKFDEIEQFLSTKRISVDYIGWSVDHYCTQRAVQLLSEPAQVESEEKPPHTTKEWLEDALGRWQVTHCHSSIREALKTLEASALREQELKMLLKQWMVAIPIAEYHEDFGCALWFKYPIDEPPYVGTPNDCGWPEYHTHFVRLTNEMIPVPVEKVSSR